MKKRLISGYSRAFAGFGLLLVGAGQLPAGEAAAIPGTGAPLAALRRMTPEGDPTIPFSYPILSDIAKSLAHSGFPASFFLNMDGSGGPGIDLRTILLYEAGILKTPVKLFMAPRKKKPDFPTLSAGSIPESSGQIPSLTPALKTPGSLGPAGSAQPDAAAGSPSGQDGAGPALSLDLNRFSVDLFVSPGKEARPERANQDAPPSLAMVQPLRFGPQTAGAQEDNFRFWTVPREIAVPECGSGLKSSFAGSFVMMSPRGLKAVEGRMFFVSEGHLLASSTGKAIVIDAPAARVSIEAGASAYVEIDKTGTVRVRVLESKAGEHGVGVKYNSEGKACEIRLAAGDDLLVASHNLTEKEKSAQSGASSPADHGDNWNKTTFSPAGLLSADSFFAESAPYQNSEQRSAIGSLRKRLK
jgi:hypothetical protein